MRPRLERLLSGKEELLYKFGMLLRPAPEDQPLKYRPGVRFQAYVAFITWFLKRYPNIVEYVIRNSTQGSGTGWSGSAKVEIVTLPNGGRALHQEGEVLNPHACRHDSGEQFLPVTLGGKQKEANQPARVIYS